VNEERIGAEVILCLVAENKKEKEGQESEKILRQRFWSPKLKWES